MISAPAGASRSAVTRRVFSTTFGESPGSKCRNNADPLDDVGRDPQRAAAGRGDRRVPQPGLDPERDQLHRRDHLAFDHRLEGRERRKCDGLVDAVDAVDLFAVHHQHARPAREQIGAAGEGALDIDAIAGHGLRDAGGGRVFGNIAVVQTHHHDFADAGAGQRLDFGRADGGALLEHQRSLAKRMNGDAADRVRRAGRTELHAAASLGSRSCAVISAMIETAISDGDTAPIGRPIGA